VSRAAQRGLALQGLDALGGEEGAAGQALVVGYGTPPEHAFAGALEALCGLPSTIR
jgi:GntR family transcriptional regulator/MocR family aminotransferase